jgi:flagellar biogenesis protein FliO
MFMKSLKVLLLYLFAFMMLGVIEAMADASSPDNAVSQNTTTPLNLPDYGISGDSEKAFPSLRETGIKMLISLTLVLVLIVVVIYLIRMLYPGSVSFRDQQLKLIKVVEKAAVTPRHSIYLVWAVDRLLVIGLSGGDFRTLAEIKDPNLLEEKLPREFSDALTRESLKFSEVYRG